MPNAILLISGISSVSVATTEFSPTNTSTSTSNTSKATTSLTQTSKAPIIENHDNTNLISKNYD